MVSTFAAATVWIFIRARLDWKLALKEKRSVSSISLDLGSLRRILNFAQARDWRCRFNSFGGIAVAVSMSCNKLDSELGETLNESESPSLSSLNSIKMTMAYVLTFKSCFLVLKTARTSAFP